jgi:ABC-type branched-subunit amino acid transport system permease subunit
VGQVAVASVLPLLLVLPLQQVWQLQLVFSTFGGGGGGLIASCTSAKLTVTSGGNFGIATLSFIGGIMLYMRKISATTNPTPAITHSTQKKILEMRKTIFFSKSSNGAFFVCWALAILTSYF